MATENALELAKLGHFTDPVPAPYRVLWEDRVARLRRYGGDNYQPSVNAPLLLIPPLMLTAEIYDVAPEISAVNALMGSGLDVWVVDFGSPEHEEGGLARTLDDHVEAIDRAIDYIQQTTGQSVHVAGYSQGGMFAYQTAAFRRSAGIASLITFGSPVDIHRNFRAIDDSIAGRAFELAQAVLDAPLEKIEGIPGFLTSTGFRMLAFRKELAQLLDFAQKLHDRRALEKREARRRFLGGEGFVAWPGPALRKFIDEFVVHNRMSSGGFVIAGRTVTLADIRCPILYFLGERDTIAGAGAVRAIQGAAPSATAFEVSVRAGHFGLVVGSLASSFCWPTVADWVRWREGVGKEPQPLRVARPEEAEEADFDEVDFDIELFYDTIVKGLGTMWRRLGRVASDFSEQADNLRWQLPRLSVLQHLHAETRINLGLALSEQAKRHPDGTFFLWEGRAFTYGEADRRVDNVVRGLIHCNVKREDRVAVLMGPRPSYLSVTTALSRLGAVPILLSPTEDSGVLAHSIEALGARVLIADPENAALGKTMANEVLVLGGAGTNPVLPPGVTNMEDIDPTTVEMPTWYEANPGRAEEVGMILRTAGRTKDPRTAQITNRRWAFSAYGTAAACSLSAKDTVYCCLPLHHPAGMLVAVGGGLVGGSRLALSASFDPEHFWDQVRRYGATVVFYARDMLRLLLWLDSSASDAQNPVRLFAGSGLRQDVWRKVLDRYGPVGVLEFYASTEFDAVLANTSGEKVGSVGRPLPGSAEVELVRCDLVSQEFIRAEDGRLVRCEPGEEGVLIAQVDATHPLVALESAGREADERIVRSAFDPDDSWFVTGNVMRRDEHGDYWFVDRLSAMLRTAEGPVSVRSIEDALYRHPSIAQAAVYGKLVAGHQVAFAVVVTEDRSELDSAALEALCEDLETPERPTYIKQVDRIPLTEGFRPDKFKLEQSALLSSGPLFVFDDGERRFVRVEDGGASLRA